LRILAAATICIALVIWAVFRIDLIRRRMSRVLGMWVYFLLQVLMALTRYGGAVSRT
jgi:hypothetical protein